MGSVPTRSVSRAEALSAEATESAATAQTLMIIFFKTMCPVAESYSTVTKSKDWIIQRRV